MPHAPDREITRLRFQDVAGNQEAGDLVEAGDGLFRETDLRWMLEATFRGPITDNNFPQVSVHQLAMAGTTQPSPPSVAQLRRPEAQGRPSPAPSGHPPLANVLPGEPCEPSGAWKLKGGLGHESCETKNWLNQGAPILLAHGGSDAPFLTLLPLRKSNRIRLCAQRSPAKSR